jgi:hypothetical protein
MSGIKFGKLVIIGIVILIIGNCHFFDNYKELATVAIYFNETNVSIYKGGLGSVSIHVDPSDSLEYYDIEYSMSNEDVAVIYKADNRGVVFSGKEIGSTVLTAKLRDAEAKAVITVLNQ